MRAHASRWQGMLHRYSRSNASRKRIWKRSLYVLSRSIASISRKTASTAGTSCFATASGLLKRVTESKTPLGSCLHDAGVSITQLPPDMMRCSEGKAPHRAATHRLRQVAHCDERAMGERARSASTSLNRVYACCTCAAEPTRAVSVSTISAT